MSGNQYFSVFHLHVDKNTHYHGDNTKTQGNSSPAQQQQQQNLQQQHQEHHQQQNQANQNNQTPKPGNQQGAAQINLPPTRSTSERQRMMDAGTQTDIPYDRIWHSSYYMDRILGTGVQPRVDAYNKSNNDLDISVKQKIDRKLLDGLDKLNLDNYGKINFEGYVQELAKQTDSTILDAKGSQTIKSASTEAPYPKSCTEGASDFDTPQADFATAFQPPPDTNIAMRAPGELRRTTLLSMESNTSLSSQQTPMRPAREVHGPPDASVRFRDAPNYLSSPGRELRDASSPFAHQIEGYYNHTVLVLSTPVAQHRIVCPR